VFATSHLVTAETLARYPGPIPIGRAHNATSVAVLNDRQMPVLCGVVGELVIGGPGVARGYINDAETTRAKFVELELSGNVDARFYRTGDLAYLDRHGEIQFVGRRDRQVKVSGYRIELDEVEATISGAPGVAGCHCLVDEQFTAFVALDPAVGSAEATKEHARARLPAYAVPQTFVFLSELPLNKNGKVDVNALKARVAAAAGSRREVASVKAVEFTDVVRQVWRKELKTDAFGDDDNFFDVGGSSLKIMLVHDELCRVLREHGVASDVEITHLFEFTTVSSLAEFLKGLAGGSA
jgi:hypothetical protein